MCDFHLINNKAALFQVCLFITKPLTEEAMSKIGALSIQEKKLEISMG